MSRRHWLMKSEPDVFGIDDLAKKGSSPWDGVRNYQARNHMKNMKVGDRVLFYHSSVEPPGVAGLAEVVREAYPDHTSWDDKSKYFDAKSKPEAPRWFMVDVAFREKFSTFVPLDQLRQVTELADMLVLRRGMRLSVQPVTAAEFRVVARLGRHTA